MAGSLIKNPGGGIAPTGGYEKYATLEDYNMNDGGYDGEVYELLYLKGNGNYIVITECAE